MTDYQKHITQIHNISFNSIIELNKKYAPKYWDKPDLYDSLNHGVAILTDEEQLNAYIASYGEMHQAKINEVLPQINISELKNSDIKIIDWGCGQGLATICLFDFFNQNNISLEHVKNVVLIETSEKALERACLHVNTYLGVQSRTLSIQKLLDDITGEEIASDQPITIHLFSNILDVPTIDLQQLAHKIKSNLFGKHYFVCMGPLNYGNNRIDSFYNYFGESYNIWNNSHGKQIYNQQGQLISSYPYTAKNRIFKIDSNICELIAVDYYLPKQFHAAYQLDSVRKALHNSVSVDKLHGLYKTLSDFELQTPFDIGASIYEDVHPILAVLSNIVTRGLPTKASPFLENKFAAFGNRKVEDDLGAINFVLDDDLNPEDLFLAMHLIDSRWKPTADNYNCQILDSDLEKEFITNITFPIISQLMQPQRDLSTITNTNWHHSQRVDFSCEFPYSIQDKNGNSRKGVVIEIDGIKYHSSSCQILSDKQRNNELNNAGWNCIRLGESDIKNNNDYLHDIGGEYISLIKKSFYKVYDSDWIKTLQLVLSPIAIARLEKTLIEALITKRLDINAKEWNVLVIEHDVPCAALAFEDIREMFNHLVKLSADYSDLAFPKVNLTIISTKEFANSPLHMDIKAHSGKYSSNIVFDMVVDCAILRRAGIENIDFSQYKCKNKCYFNIRSAHYHRNERQIYTSDRINYQPLVITNNQGRYDDIITNVGLLTYFLQLLFRKKEFRPGQTPILSRALQNKSVIGLLPTGGGKSLTYQIAALLQPGVTLVIDPLRSLMKDQYDGLIKAGIDCCTYINSAIEAPNKITEKKDVDRYRTEERERRALKMESSELQFVFLSPERLSIKNFRDRLKNMHDTGVYFSYGVIDEVHCVSEWGHDFRFSYLHLGRNLYQYVLPKQLDGLDGHITLFGLTATASFDVLADVERELSGNGAFPLDSETIVRDGNTNRFELQYKIEPIHINFEEKNDFIKPNKWTIYDAKSDSLDDLISNIPNYLDDLLSDESLSTIANGYLNGPRQDDKINADSLKIAIPSDMLEVSDSYNHGGIVFCPHKKSTGVAVHPNAKKLREKHPGIYIGTFVGSNSDSKNDNEEDDEDKISFENLELFRDDKLPIMIATKAFGMGIDKPDVRFTINMNYSSSLESFVQEAGRAGRDRKMALSTIMFSKYKIARVKKSSNYYAQEKDKWYDADNLEEISERKQIPLSEIEICDETTDLVKLKCKQCGDKCKRFEKNCCSYSCSNCENRSQQCYYQCEHYNNCPLAKVASEDRWSHYEHLTWLKEKYPFITIENYEYLNADYETVLYFYNNNFKGEMFEKRYMYQLLSQKEMDVCIGEETNNEVTKTIEGFLTTLQSVAVGNEIASYVYYADDYADIAKAIYRMCCIDLIDDFTQDYNTKQFRIVSVKKSDGEYYSALERYLKRYYSEDRAKELIKEVPNYKGDNEIHKCLGFLTHFIYDKIAVKRKRAIDDMHAFCIHGIDEQKDWKIINEELKDELYFYFNSKYARRAYQTESGLDYSLTDDTQDGKVFTTDILFKFMDVVDNEWIANNSESGSTQIDNAKHLYGAVRLIRRQITDDNAAIYLLAAFCLMFLGTNNNNVLVDELSNMYLDGMRVFYKDCINNGKDFWLEVFDRFNNNQYVSTYFKNNGSLLKSISKLEIHTEELSNINNKYTA